MTTRVIDFKYAPQSVWTAICRPDDPYKTLVREDGALLYDFQSALLDVWQFGRILEFGIATNDALINITQVTESAKVPIVITKLEYANAVLELQTIGHQHNQDHRTDVVLWKITAKSNIDEILTGLRIDVVERDRVFVGRTHSPAPTPANIIFSVDPSTIGELDFWKSISQVNIENPDDPDPGDVAFVSYPQTLIPSHSRGYSTATGLSTKLQALKSNESISGAIMIPLNHSEISELDESWAKVALQVEREFWTNLDLSQTTLYVPDEDIMDMLNSCARNILQARELEDGLPVYQVGATVYRSLFVVDGHFFLEAVQYLGDQDSASRAIDTLLKRVHPNGAIYEMEHHTKETGISIATLIRQTELLGDEQRLRDLWHIIQNGVAYIETLREEARQLPEDDPCHNLLPMAYGDGGIGGQRGEYTTTFWILFGLRSAMQAAYRLGYEDDAQQFEASYNSLLADFKTHAAKHMKTLDDGTPYLPIRFDDSGDHHWIPNYPDEVPIHHHLKPQSATWAFCQAIYPGEIFEPNDSLVTNFLKLLDQIDDEEGIPAETGWLPYRSLWSYYASFAGHVWQYANRPDKTVDYLYDFANHASATRVWREEQSLTHTGNGQYFGDMPHNWASVEFIRMVRNLLVFERGDTLELLSGLPAEWMRDEIVVDNMPTAFGFIRLHVKFHDNGQLNLSFERTVAGHREPNGVSLHLKGLSDVIINEESVDSQDVYQFSNLKKVVLSARLTKG